MFKGIALTLAFVCVFLTDCRWFGVKGNGRVITEERPVTDFTELHSDGSFTVEWKSGPPSLSITTDENLMSIVESRVTDNHLRLHTRERILPTHGLKVVASSPNRTGCKLQGA